MNISDVLAPDAVIAALKANGKKQLLQELAARAAQLTGIPERKIFESLNERERLGSTGVGQGIAIPHSRVADVKGIVGVFARLESPIDYNAVDKQPVDLVFMLLAPEGAGADHLKALARVSRLLRNQQACEKLRAATKPEAIYAILTEPMVSGASSRAA
jgi:PTS system nitrogen regulatory IIA component